MHIKIFFGDKSVFLCDEINKELNEILHHPDAIFIDEISSRAIKSLLHEIKKDEFHAGIIWNKDIEELKKAFFKHFIIIEAAGGIVMNKQKELLFIYRRGKWDLPKGKMEKDEDTTTCAIREVSEETGVKNLSLKKKIGETYYNYDEFGKHYLKICHWFYLTSLAEQQLKPQTEEDITEVKWIPTSKIKEPMKNTYSSIKEILSKFFDEP